MTRAIAALAIASFSLMASAADKPLPVTVANPVVPVEVMNADPVPVSSAGAAVNVNKADDAGGAYYLIETLYTNTGTRPVLFTGLSTDVFSVSSCAASVKPLYLNFLASNSGSSGTPGSATVSARFEAGQDRYGGGCVWTATVPAGLVVGPGQLLVGYVEFQSTTNESVQFNASGYQLR